MDKILIKLLSVNYKDKLFITDKNLDKNFFPHKRTKEEIEKFTHDDLINDYLIERVRRFNISATYLMDSLDNAITICFNMVKQREMEGQLTPFFRKELRNICVNLEIYIDKLIGFCRYYFFFNLKKTENKKVFIQTLKQFADKNENIMKFYNFCNKMYQEKSFKFVYQVRCDEVHNESVLDLHEYKFADNDLIIEDLGYKVSNQEIVDNIYEVLLLVVELKSLFQNILEKIKEPNIASYIEKNFDKLKNIVDPSQRCEYKYIKEKYIQ